MSLGAQFQKNPQRSYSEGHERDDIVEHRKEFIDYFFNRKDCYYAATDGDTPASQVPNQTPPCILICKCHELISDESWPLQRKHNFIRREKEDQTWYLIFWFNTLLDRFLVSLKTSKKK